MFSLMAVLFLPKVRIELQNGSHAGENMGTETNDRD